MDVLFPFGYGLSYTTFEYTGLKLSRNAMKDTDTVEVSVTVKNTGRVAGKTVVQVYVGDTEGYMNAVRPVRELRAFQKVALEPGESKTVTFTLGKRAFASWRPEIHDWWVEIGDFSIEAGDSIANLPLKETLKVESTVELPKHYDADSIFMDLMADPKAKAVVDELMSKSFAVFSRPEEEASEAASEAISEDMTAAMLSYMPLRSTLSFGGSITDEMMEELLKKLNG